MAKNRFLASKLLKTETKPELQFYRGNRTELT